MTKLLRIICAVVVFMGAAVQVSAQVALPTTTSTSTDTAITLPDPLTPEAANALISRLSDTEVRQLLIDQLNTQATEAVSEEEAGLSEFFFGHRSAPVVDRPTQYSGNRGRVRRRSRSLGILLRTPKCASC